MLEFSLEQFFRFCVLDLVRTSVRNMVVVALSAIANTRLARNYLTDTESGPQAGATFYLNSVRDYSATSLVKRMKMVAASARVAFPAGASSVSVRPLINFLPLHHCMGSSAQELIWDMSV